MSFGPNAIAKSGVAGMQQAIPALQNSATQAQGRGNNLLDFGVGNTQAGAGFFRNLLGGNQADTMSMLQPDIDRLRGANQQTLQAASTLMPRGGGRSSTLFQLPFQQNQQVQSLFNTGRVAGANALPQIGGQQSGQGANLFNIGNQALEGSGQIGGNLANFGLQQQQYQNAQRMAMVKMALGAAAGFI